MNALSRLYDGIRRLGPQRVLRVIALGSLAVLASFQAGAQVDDIEAVIEQSQTSGSARELPAQANAQPPKTDDKHELAIFYHKRGMANYRLGNYSRAIDELRLALEYNQAKRSTPNDWGNRWRIQIDLATVYALRGDRLSHIEFLDEVAAEYRQSIVSRYFWVQLRLMSAHSSLGQWLLADRAKHEADAMLAKLRTAKGWSRTQLYSMRDYNFNTAQVFEGQGNHREAERSYRVALEWAEKELDFTQRILPPGHQASRSALVVLGRMSRRLAANLATQGKYGEAEVYARAGLEKALVLFGFNTVEIGDTLDVMGWTRFQQNDIAAAEKFYRFALAAAEGSGVVQHSGVLAARRAALGNVLLVQGLWAEANKLYEERNKSLQSNPALLKRINFGHLGWAYALHKIGQSTQAVIVAERLIGVDRKRPVSNRWYVAQLRGVQGMALAGSGKTPEALKAFQDSIPDLIRRDHDDATVENTGYWRAFWQRVILEGYLDLLAKLHVTGETIPELDLVDESFRIADIARGSSVQEAITAMAARAQLPDKSLAELARKGQDALNRIVALNQILSRVAAQSTDARAGKILTDMRAEIERLRTEHTALRSDIRKRYPEYADLIEPKAAGIGDVRNALAPSEALVSIYVGESQSYVWTIGAGGKATFRIVPLTRDEIAAEVRELRKAVDFGEGNVARLRAFDFARARNLYRALLEPDEALWKDAQVLNLIPHGALGELPFALLITAPSQQPSAGAQSAYTEAPWLLRKVAIAQLPSASALAALRRTPAAKTEREAFIGFGDPLFTADAGAGARRGLVRNLAVQKIADPMEEQLKEAAQGKRPGQWEAALTTRSLSRAFAQLSALPDTSDELKEITATLNADPNRDVFLNRQATEKNLKQATLGNRRVIAFATHGIAPGELTGLDQPALALSNPALVGDTDNDGFLTMEEVLGLKLDADWVVLSACNTASADGRGSEAVSGLGRAFFYAGARSLLVSNWAVESTSARLLTTELFKRQSENPQLTRAEALRQSMLALMEKRATDPLTKQSAYSYAHPAFWVPFTLVGDGGR